MPSPRVPGPACIVATLAVALLLLAPALATAQEPVPGSDRAAVRELFSEEVLDLLARPERVELLSLVPGIDDDVQSLWDRRVFAGAFPIAGRVEIGGRGPQRGLLGRVLAAVNGDDGNGPPPHIGLRVSRGDVEWVDIGFNLAGNGCGIEWVNHLEQEGYGDLTADGARELRTRLTRLLLDARQPLDGFPNPPYAARNDPAVREALSLELIERLESDELDVSATRQASLDLDYGAYPHGLVFDEPLAEFDRPRLTDADDPERSALAGIRRAIVGGLLAAVAEAAGEERPAPAFFEPTWRLTLWRGDGETLGITLLIDGPNGWLRVHHENGLLVRESAVATSFEQMATVAAMRAGWELPAEGPDVQALEDPALAGRLPEGAAAALATASCGSAVLVNGIWWPAHEQYRDRLTTMQGLEVTATVRLNDPQLMHSLRRLLVAGLASDAEPARQDRPDPPWCVLFLDGPDGRVELRLGEETVTVTGPTGESTVVVGHPEAPFAVRWLVRYQFEADLVQSECGICTMGTRDERSPLPSPQRLLRYIIEHRVRGETHDPGYRIDADTWRTLPVDGDTDLDRIWIGPVAVDGDRAVVAFTRDITVPAPAWFEVVMQRDGLSWCIETVRPPRPR